MDVDGSARKLKAEKAHPAHHFAGALLRGPSVLPDSSYILRRMPIALAVCPLTEGWTFKQADGDGEDAWMPVRRVPTNVHLDLIDNGKYVITWGVFGNIIQCMTDHNTRIEYPTPF